MLSAVLGGKTGSRGGACGSLARPLAAQPRPRPPEEAWPPAVLLTPPQGASGAGPPCPDDPTSIFGRQRLSLLPVPAQLRPRNPGAQRLPRSPPARAQVTGVGTAEGHSGAAGAGRAGRPRLCPYRLRRWEAASPAPPPPHEPRALRSSPVGAPLARPHPALRRPEAWALHSPRTIWGAGGGGGGAAGPGGHTAAGKPTKNQQAGAAEARRGEADDAARARPSEGRQTA